jgi:hypothetical protein
MNHQTMFHYNDADKLLCTVCLTQQKC